MSKARLEAFSDAVFAIVITLLVLDIRIPEVSYGELPQALVHAIPQVTSYILSFAIIGLYWVGHHYYMRFVERVNSVFIWINLFFLLLISFLPVPTSLLGRYQFQTLPILIYGIHLLALNLYGLGMLHYFHRHKELTTEAFTKGIFKRFVRIYLIVNGMYLAAIGLSFFAPVVSYIIYILVLLFAIKVYAIRET